jgi:hypothetical protein
VRRFAGASLAIFSDQNEGSALDYLPELDEFELLADHVNLRVAFGDRIAAVKECDEVIAAGRSGRR